MMPRGAGVSRRGGDEREVRTGEGEGEAEEKPRGHEGQPFIPAGHRAVAPMDAVYLNLQSPVSELDLWPLEELLWNYSTS